MWVLLACLVIGAVLGWQRWLPHKLIAFSGKSMMLGVMLLLVGMGIRLGANRETLNQLGNYGLQALVFAMGSVGASVVLVMSFESLLKRSISIRTEQSNTGKQEGRAIQANGTEQGFETELKNHNELEKKGNEAHPYRMTAFILGGFALGIVSGSLFFPYIDEYSVNLVTTVALNYTIFAVGLDLGRNKEVWSQIIRLGWQVFLAPAGVAIGSVAAGMVIGKTLGWSWLEGGAVGAGFGWYSLSGVLITQIHSVSLGTIAFLSNIMRELLAILIIPWLSRRVGILALVAPGGATTMDTTLPLLATVGPPGVAVVALVNGVSLSALVPIIVPLLLG